MEHDRKIVLGGVALTKARNNRYEFEAAEQVMDELETCMIDGHIFCNAPFQWIGLILRFGLVNEDAPHYQGIDKRDGELALAIEIDVHDLIGAGRETVKELFMVATLKAVIHAGKKYHLPTDTLEKKLEESQRELQRLINMVHS